VTINAGSASPEGMGRCSCQPGHFTSCSAATTRQQRWPPARSKASLESAGPAGRSISRRPALSASRPVPDRPGTLAYLSVEQPAILVRPAGGDQPEIKPVTAVVEIEVRDQNRRLIARRADQGAP
jgi:hypothetical protein